MTLRRGHDVPGMDDPSATQDDVSAEPLVSGVRWGVFQTVVNKVIATGAYVALGWLLTDEDFGLFAFVIGLAAVAQALQDRGVLEFLISKGRPAFGAYWIKSLRYAFFLSAVAAVLLTAVGLLLRQDLDQTYHLTVVLVALSIPASSIWTVASAKLSLEFEFAWMSHVSFVSILAQYATAISLAALGAGAASLAAALLVSALVRSACGMFLLRTDFRRRQRQGPDPIWPAGSWLVLAALGTGLAAQGDYLAGGLLVSAAALGVYYFAYQLPVQLATVLGSALEVALLPWLADALKRDPRRATDAMHVASRYLILSVSLLGAALAGMAPFIEAALWRGQWAEAVPAIQVLALVMPFRAVIEPARAALLGRALFRVWAFEAAQLGLATVGGAIVAGLLRDDALSLAVGVGASSALASLGMWYRTHQRFTGDLHLSRLRARGLVTDYALLTAAPWFLAVAPLFSRLVPRASVSYALASVVAMVLSFGLAATRYRQELLHAISTLLRLKDPRGLPET